MTKLNKLASEIANVLDKHQSSQDVAIYYENKRLSNFEDGWESEEGFLGSEFTEWANDDTITVTFEGPLYSAMNYGTDNQLVQKLSKLVDDNGFYWELGNAWNLSLHEK